MMSILVSGPHQPGIDIDVYLRPLVEISKHSGMVVLMLTTGTRGNPSHYIACCFARLLIYRVAVLFPDSVKGKRIALIA